MVAASFKTDVVGFAELGTLATLHQVPDNSIAEQQLMQFGAYEILGRPVAGTGNGSRFTGLDLVDQPAPAPDSVFMVWRANGVLERVSWAVIEALASAGDAAPTQQSTSVTGVFALTIARRLSNNVECLSDNSGVDFEVAADAPAGSKWYVRFKHQSCIVSVAGNVGSINGTVGGSVWGINGGAAIAEVDSNPASAPVVLVRGDIIVPPISTGAKAYVQDDHGKDYKVTSGTQSFSAVGNYAEGFYVNLFKETAGDVTIDGPGATNATLHGLGGAVTVKKLGTALVAFGTNGRAVIS